MIAAHVAFFAVLVLNTVFSVRFFGPMIRRDSWQWLVDGALLLIYAGLALSIGQGTAFPFAAAALFVVATLKYAAAWQSIPDYVLKRKITIDLSGAILCLAALGVALAGFPLAAAVAMAALFAAANVVVLWLRPMYRI
jgi:hypothetical protein